MDGGKIFVRKITEKVKNVTPSSHIYPSNRTTKDIATTFE